MPSTSQWLAFIVASILFIQVPGPSLLFTIGRALTVAGATPCCRSSATRVGVVVQVLLVSVGLGALVATSATVYTVIKVVGAAYVCWLGFQAIRHRADARLAMRGAPGVTRAGHRSVLPGWRWG